MVLKLDSGFYIANCYHVDFEEIAIELSYKGQPVFLVNKDRGYELMEVEIYNQCVFGYNGITLQFPLDDFLCAIEKSVEILKNY